MKVAEAKQLAVDLIVRDVGGSPLAITLDRASPDGDVGKFTLQGQVARAIHHFDGWYVPINLAWFDGSFDPPAVGVALIRRCRPRFGRPQPESLRELSERLGSAGLSFSKSLHAP